VATYNERLFDGKSFRSKLHYARYLWVNSWIKRWELPSYSMLELGCYDGKTIDFLSNKPATYAGYDANWEGGLDIAKTKWSMHPDYSFHTCEKPADFSADDSMYEVSVCLETLEHIPAADLEAYIVQLSKKTKQYCLISVPNEKGPVLFFKHIIKSITQEKAQTEAYTLKEFLYGSIGRLDKVARRDCGHKGFDYDALAVLLKKYFTILKTEAIPYPAIPHALGFNVGFILKKKSFDRSKKTNRSTRFN
jgi:hypothetical protein